MSLNNKERFSCPVCNSEKTDRRWELYDDRYGYPGIFQINKCCECGHKFIFGNFTPELLTSLYTNYYPRSSFNLEDYKPYHEVSGIIAWLDGANCSAFRWVPRDVRVLDIGCGFGETLGYHKTRGCDVFGVEADENIRRVADKFKFKIHVGLFDPAIYEPDYFDYVTMDQVLEHVTDPIATLKGVAGILSPRGMVVLSVPNANGWGAKVFGRKWINWHAPYHMQHFSMSSMTIAARQAGFIVEKATTITSSAWLYYQWMHLVTYPQLGVPSCFWLPKGKLPSVNKTLIRTIWLLHLTKFNHLLTRVCDGLSIGDNLLFLLRKN